MACTAGIHFREFIGFLKRSKVEQSYKGVDENDGLRTGLLRIRRPSNDNSFGELVDQSSGHLILVDLMPTELPQSNVANGELRNFNEPTPSASCHNGADEDEHSFAGSPLKVSLLQISGLAEQSENGTLLYTNAAYGQRFTEANSELVPLETAVARRLLSDLLNGLRWDEETDELLDTKLILVACDGHDRFKTAFLGVQVPPHHKEGVTRTRSVCISSIGYGGKAAILRAMKIPAAKMRSASGQVLVTSAVRSEMELLASDTSQSTSQGKVASCELLLSAQWKTVGASCETLLSGPPKGTAPTLHLKTGWLDRRSTAFATSVELNTLMSFTDSLTSHNISWPSDGTVPLVSSFNGDDDADGFDSLPVMDSCRQLLFASQQRNSVLDETTAGTMTLAGCRFVQSLVDGAALFDCCRLRRDSLDFTELLWLILKRCSSYIELTNCVRLVLDAVKGRSIQPQIRASNRCSLARLCREMLADSGAVLPRLEGTLPVQLLVECGLEKLRNDYNSFFISVASSEDTLRSWPLLSADYSSSLEEQTASLRRLHVCFESVNLASSLLGLPYSRLLHLANECFAKFEVCGEGELSTTRISVPLRSADAATVIANWASSQWRCSSLYEKAGERRHASFWLRDTVVADCRRPPIAGAKYEPLEDVNTNTTSYYVVRTLEEVMPL